MLTNEKKEKLISTFSCKKEIGRPGGYLLHLSFSELKGSIHFSYSLCASTAANVGYGF